MSEKVLDVFYTEKGRLELVELPSGYFLVRSIPEGMSKLEFQLFSSKSYHEANEYFEKKIGC